MQTWLAFYLSGRKYSPGLNSFFDQCWEAYNSSVYRGLEMGDIERLRQRLISDQTVIQRTDFGARGHLNYNQRISNLAKLSLSPRPQMLFLSSLAHINHSRVIVEMGTCLGLGTAYLAQANPHAQVLTLEGDPKLADWAKSHWEDLKISNINLLVGSFYNTLEQALQLLPPVDFIFLDGHHDGTAMQRYWHTIKPYLAPGAIVCVDDIRWSADMFHFWTTLRHDPNVIGSIDGGKIGLCKLRNMLSTTSVHITWPGLPTY